MFGVIKMIFDLIAMLVPFIWISMSTAIWTLMYTKLVDWDTF